MDDFNDSDPDGLGVQSDSDSSISPYIYVSSLLLVLVPILLSTFSCNDAIQFAQRIHGIYLKFKSSLNSMRQWIYDTIWSMTVKASCLCIDACHVGYFRFHLLWTFPVMQWCMVIVIWIRRYHRTFSSFIGFSLLAHSIFGNIFYYIVVFFLYDYNYFRVIEVHPVEYCSVDEFGENVAWRDGAHYIRDWDLIRNFDEFQDPNYPMTNANARDDNVDDIGYYDYYLDSKIYNIIMEMNQIADYHNDLEWNQFGSAFSLRSDDDDDGFCTFHDHPFGSMDQNQLRIDDLWTEWDALNDSYHRLKTYREKRQNGSIFNPDWKRSFWEKVNKMKFGDGHLFEYVPQGSGYHADPFCDYYIRIRVKFRYPNLLRISGYMMRGHFFMLLGYYWWYWSFTRTLSHWSLATILWAQWTHQWIANVLFHLTVEWINRISAWNVDAVKCQLEEAINSQPQIEKVLGEMNLFPDAINAIVADTVFHPLIEQFGAEMAMGSVLSEQWGMDQHLIELIGIYAFRDPLATVQVLYPAITAGTHFKLEDEIRLKANMRGIRVMIVYCDDFVKIAERFTEYQTVNGSALRLHWESKTLVPADDCTK